MERLGLEEDVAIESRLVSQDDRERPEPRRGLQLRHPQARRRVRRRHQQAARDDLRRARQGPPQRGPDRDGRRASSTRRSTRCVEQFTSAASRRRRWNLEGLAAALEAMGLEGEGTTEDELWEIGGREAIAEHLRDARRRRSSTAKEQRGRRDRLGDGRAARAAADDRLAVGRAPDRARRHAPRHRPARLRPAGPAQRVPARGVRACTRSCATSSATRSPARSSASRSLARPAHRRRRRCRCPVAATLARPAAMAAGDERRRTDCVGGAARTPSRRAAGPAAGGRRAGCRPVPRSRGVRESLGDEVVGGGRRGAGRAARRPGYTPTGERIGRNDPCWCGSGQKYKKCHGKLTAGVASTVAPADPGSCPSPGRRPRHRRSAWAPTRRSGSGSRASATSSDRPARSSSSGRPSTTADRRRCSRPGWTTRSTLYLAGVAPYLVVTGGKAAATSTTEAAVARAYAIARGVPDDRILVEDDGRTTLESLRAVAALLSRQSDPRRGLRVGPAAHAAGAADGRAISGSPPGARRPRRAHRPRTRAACWAPTSTSSARWRST